MPIKLFLYILGLSGLLYANCPSKMVQSDLFAIRDSGKQCVVYTEKELMECVENFPYKNYVYLIDYVSTSLIVWNENMAYLNVSVPRGITKKNGKWIEKPNARNFCVDAHGIREIDYYAPYSKETIEEKIRKIKRGSK